MTSRAQIEQAIRASYAARSAGDLDGTLVHFADDGTFEMNARSLGAGDRLVGKAAVRAAVAELIKTWKFDDWKEVSLLVEGDTAALHWRAHVTNTTTGKHAVMDCFDFITFRGGKIAEFRQSADTAMMMQLAG